jgi:hypothetical protein
MFAHPPKLFLGAVEGDKESRVHLMPAILLTKAALPRPDSQRNHNCTKKWRRNAQLRRLCDYDKFALSPGCWFFEVVHGRLKDFETAKIVS